ncbi:bifunctional aspartate transaminase/aspartate 4-decarboxylase [Enterococcus sp. AZ126]|uniref:bifunctional aspartate transaminase/aspartate 4-decarboxylase n=1 Tax=Enterococcus sp. AZ126 TaxID=2774635 RepID=UPI003F260944
MDKKEEQRIEKLGAFEVNEQLLALAQKDEKNSFFLNAGKGNPNWINTQARLAFCQLVEFGVLESQRTLMHGDMAGSIEDEGIYDRFLTFFNTKGEEQAVFFRSGLHYLEQNLELSMNDVVAELVNGAIGNNYPTPNRVLSNSETILAHYLEEILFNNQPLSRETQVFPTEGGTAAMVYIFHSLKENQLIHPGDKIAISSPIFTPYLQIPELNDYEMVEIDLSATEANHWEVSLTELDKLKNPDIKAFFIVNPSNPGSKALGEKEREKMKEVVADHPDLMIITDDVYGSFVEDFQSIYATVPHNTLLVYSYSKLFGATGWRLGMIALNEETIFDQLIQRLPKVWKPAVEKRYASVVLEPKKMKFIDRLVADSRSIGLYHTSGLSTPQQVMEVLFSLTHLICIKEKDTYIDESKKLISQRYDLLHDTLNYPKDSSHLNAKYYSLIDVYELAEHLYGNSFKDYLKDQFEEIDFLLNLAQKNGVVLMDGVGFGTKPGEVRVSSANLPTKSYKVIGEQILELLERYYQEYIKK